MTTAAETLADARKMMSLEAFGAVVDATARLRLIDDMGFERSQLFRNSEDQGIASRLRHTGLGLDSYEANQMRRTNQLQGYRDLGINILAGIRDGALSGSEDVGQAIMEGIADAALTAFDAVSDEAIAALMASFQGE